jgi:hypothetical protein
VHECWRFFVYQGQRYEYVGSFDYVRPEAWIQVFELRSVCPNCGRPLTVWRHKASEKTVQCRDGANNVGHLAELY